MASSCGRSIRSNQSVLTGTIPEEQPPLMNDSDRIEAELLFEDLREWVAPEMHPSAAAVNGPALLSSPGALSSPGIPLAVPTVVLPHAVASSPEEHPNGMPEVILSAANDDDKQILPVPPVESLSIPQPTNEMLPPTSLLNAAVQQSSIQATELQQRSKQQTTTLQPQQPHLDPSSPTSHKSGYAAPVVSEQGSMSIGANSYSCMSLEFGDHGDTRAAVPLYLQPIDLLEDGSVQTADHMSVTSDSSEFLMLTLGSASSKLWMNPLSQGSINAWFDRNRRPSFPPPAIPPAIGSNPHTSSGNQNITINDHTMTSVTDSLKQMLSLNEKTTSLESSYAATRPSMESILTPDFFSPPKPSFTSEISK